MKRRETGFALVLVIWALVLLTTVATAFGYAVRHETRSAGDLSAQVRAEAVAAAAVRHAVLALDPANETAAWRADGQLRVLPWPDATVTVRVRSESARIDLNHASRELLVGLFERLHDTDPEALADAIIDWRDRDDNPEPLGAERDTYLQAGYRYGPANQPFSSVYELSQVIGFAYEHLETLLPYLTVHSADDLIDAYSADANVLAAVPGITLVDAEDFVLQREAALAEGDKPDFGLLREGRRFLDTSTGGETASAYLLEIAVEGPDGYVLRQQISIRPNPETGFTPLSFNRLAAVPEAAKP